MYVGNLEKEGCMLEARKSKDVCRKLGEGRMYVGSWEQEGSM